MHSMELFPLDKIFITRVNIVMIKYSCDMLSKPTTKLSSKISEHHSHDARIIDLLEILVGTKKSLLTVPELRMLSQVK